MSTRDSSGTEREVTRRKRRLKLLRERPSSIDRRQFITQGCALSAVGVGLGQWALHRESAFSSEHEGAPVRPPGALAIDADFESACVRCGLCGTVCENGCIRFFGIDEREHGAFTPYLDVRRRSCTLCMRCTQICPSGALRPIDDERAAILAEVDMGRAVVDPELCLSYLGRLCGYCHDACPYPNTSIKLSPPALPVVTNDCVGCGRCVEECPQTPTAIRIERRTT